MASEKILKQKQQEVEELAAKFKEAKLVLFTDYKGISVKDVTTLRDELRKEKNYALSDLIRNKLSELNITINDKKVVK